MINILLDSTIVLNDSIDAINQIGKNTFDTAENTKFGIIATITFCVSIATFIVSVLTYYAQRATQKNTSRLNKKEQKAILLNMVKQFYRSYVIMAAVLYKMRHTHFDYYPSEIYLEGIKMETKLLCNYFFSNKSEKVYMDNLSMLGFLNNFNLSIDVCNKHLKNPDIDTNTKESDIKDLIKGVLKNLGVLHRFYSSIICDNNISLTDRISDVFRNVISKEAMSISNYNYEKSDISFDYNEFTSEFGIDSKLNESLYIDRKKYTDNVNFYLGKYKDSGLDVLRMIKINHYK